MRMTPFRAIPHGSDAMLSITWTLRMEQIPSPMAVKTKDGESAWQNAEGNGVISLLCQRGAPVSSRHPHPNYSSPPHYGVCTTLLLPDRVCRTIGCFLGQPIQSVGSERENSNNDRQENTGRAVLMATTTFDTNSVLFQFFSKPATTASCNCPTFSRAD